MEPDTSLGVGGEASKKMNAKIKIKTLLFQNLPNHVNLGTELFPGYAIEGLKF